MFDRMRTSILAAIAMALLTPAGALAALPDGPPVVAGYKDGPVDVPGGGVSAEVAALPLPKGIWSVRATAFLEGTTYGLTRHVTTCRLAMGKDVDVVTATPTGSGGGSSLSLLLTMEHKFAEPGKASLSCSSDVPTGQVKLRFIKITGVKIGKLTRQPFGGTATTVGTGSPRVIAGYREGSKSIPDDGQGHQIARLALPAGRWSIIAKGVVSGTGADHVHARCILKSGSESDEARPWASALGTPADMLPFSAQVAVDLASGGAATLVCYGGGSHKVGKLRITALKAGTLTTGRLGVSSTTTGSGNPVAISGYDSSLPVAPGALQQVSSLPLPAGAFVVTAKVGFEHLNGGLTTTKCQLRLGNDYDESIVVQDTDLLTNAPMTLQAVHTFPSAAEASLWCSHTGSYDDIGAFFVQLTAVRAGSLANGGI